RILMSALFPYTTLFRSASLKMARALGATTSLDTGWDSQGRWMEDLKDCLPLLDWLFVNDREAARLTGRTEAGQIVTALHRQGARSEEHTSELQSRENLV